MYGYYFVLKINGVDVTLRADGFQYRYAADRALARALRDCQYKRPRFWQISRWRETRPRKEVLRFLRERDI